MATAVPDAKEFSRWFLRQLTEPTIPPPNDVHSLTINFKGNFSKFFKVIWDQHIKPEEFGNRWTTFSKTEKDRERRKLAQKRIIEAAFKVTTLQYLEIRNYSSTALPEGIGNLTNLVELTITLSELTQLPDDIGNLRNIVVMNFDECNITSLPESFGNLTTLQNLVISRNRLASFPESIGNLASLHNLIYPRNFVTRWPASFTNLTNLRTIDAGNNDMTELPDDIGNLTSLSILRLNTNQLRSLPDSIGNLQNLTDLYVDENRELTTIPQSLGNLQRLRLLDLSNTGLQTVPPSHNNPELTIFDDMAGLRVLIVYATPWYIGNVQVLRRIEARIQRRRLQEQGGPPAALGRGVAFQVHDAFKRIDKQRLISILRRGNNGEIPVFNTNQAFIEYFDRLIREYLNSIPNSRNEPLEKAAILTKYDAIYNSMLRNINFEEGGYEELITNVLEFVRRQPPRFRQNYAYYFTYDNFHAYDPRGEGSRTLSCAKGIIERFVFALKSAIEQTQIENERRNEATKEYNPIYAEIEEAIKPKSIQASITEYSRECYSQDRVTQKETDDEKVEELKRCIREKLVFDFGANSITPATTHIINEAAEGLRNMLGGRRRKSKTVKRRRSHRKTHKKYRR